MKYLILIFFALLVFSCSTNQKPEVNQTSNFDEAYIDTPFSQEYHDGYVIDDRISEANDVRAIQPDNK